MTGGSIGADEAGDVPFGMPSKTFAKQMAVYGHWCCRHILTLFLIIQKTAPLAGV